MSGRVAPGARRPAAGAATSRIGSTPVIAGIGLCTVLALLLGIAGTTLGGISVHWLRSLDAENGIVDEGASVISMREAIAAVESSVNALEKNAKSAPVATTSDTQWRHSLQSTMAALENRAQDADNKYEALKNAVRALATVQREQWHNDDDDDSTPSSSFHS